MLEEWNSEEIMKFLCICEESECLWSIRHAGYINRNKRDVALNELRDALIKEGSHSQG